MYGTMFRAAMQWQAAWMSTAQMAVSAATVIQLRTMQMSLGIMKPEEATRMLLEKPSAFMRATEMSARALAANRGLAAATLAGMAPIRRTTQANAKRLGRRTPAKTRR